MKQGFSATKLFSLEDNAVPTLVRDSFIGLIAPLEEFFEGGSVPNHSPGNFSSLPDLTREPDYPLLSEFKKDWIEWVHMEIRARLELGVRYWNFRGEVLSGTKFEPANSNQISPPSILFLRKFRRVGTMHESFDEDRYTLLREMGASHISSGEFELDTMLRGKIERKFPSSPVVWFANPIDPLSVSGYLTQEEGQSDWRLNQNSIPLVMTPIYGKTQDWRESVDHLIRACDAILISNPSHDGGLAEELQLVTTANALTRTFVTHPENLDSSFSGVRHIDDLTETELHKLDGADPKVLEKLVGWGHWAGFESLEYARQYVAAIDALWGDALDSNREISPGFFSSLFTALMALLVFRGELHGAGGIAKSIAVTIVAKSQGQEVEFLQGPGDFSTQDLRAVDILLRTSTWYSRNDDLFRLVNGFDFLGMAKA